MSRIEAIEAVFGLPDTFTSRPRTFGEMDPIAEQGHLQEMKRDFESMADVDATWDEIDRMEAERQNSR